MIKALDIIELLEDLPISWEETNSGLKDLLSGTFWRKARMTTQLHGYWVSWSWEKKTDLLCLQFHCPQRVFDDYARCFIERLSDLAGDGLISEVKDDSALQSQIKSNYNTSDRLFRARHKDFDVLNYSFQYRDSLIAKKKVYVASLLLTQGHPYVDETPNKNMEIKIQGYSRLISRMVRLYREDASTRFDWNHSIGAFCVVRLSYLIALLGALSVFAGAKGLFGFILWGDAVDAAVFRICLWTALGSLILFWILGGRFGFEETVRLSTYYPFSTESRKGFFIRNYYSFPGGVVSNDSVEEGNVK